MDRYPLVPASYQSVFRQAKVLLKKSGRQVPETITKTGIESFCFLHDLTKILIQDNGSIRIQHQQQQGGASKYWKQELRHQQENTESYFSITDSCSRLSHSIKFLILQMENSQGQIWTFNNIKVTVSKKCSQHCKIIDRSCQFFAGGDLGLRLSISGVVTTR